MLPLWKLFFIATDGTNGVELWSLDVCETVDAAVSGCVPATAALDKCETKLSDATRTLLLATNKCGIKNSDAAVKGNAFDGQACKDAAKTKFTTKVTGLTAKDPACPPSCVGAGSAAAWAGVAQSAVDAMFAGIYCDLSSATAQDDGFRGAVPVAASKKCENGVAKAVFKLAASLLKCNRKAADMAVKGKSFDRSECQAKAALKYETFRGNVMACPPCLDDMHVAVLALTVADAINGDFTSGTFCATP